MAKGSDKIFYGWWIVLSAFVCQFIGVGICIYTFGIFFKPLAREFGWSRAEISAAMIILSLVQAAIGPIYGRWVDWYGPKKVIAPAAFLMGMTLIFFHNLTSSIWHFYILYFLTGIGASGLMGVPPATMVSQWFRKRRGLALGISMVGAGSGGIVMAPFSNYLISTLGFRKSYALLGLLVWGIMIPIATLIMKKSPEEMGLLPDGEKKNPNLPERRHTSFSEGMILRNAWRTYSFWLLIAGLFLSSNGMTALITHLVPLLTDTGFSSEKAALFISLVTAVSLLGRITSGYLADKLVARYVAMAFYLSMAFSMLFLLIGGGNWMIFLFIFLYGMGVGGEIDLMAYLTGECFGFRSFGEIFGYIYMGFLMGQATGPVLMGHIYDVTNSYNLALIIFFFALAVASICVSRTRPLKFMSKEEVSPLS